MSSSATSQELERPTAPRTAPSWLAILLLVNAIVVGVLSATRPHESNWSVAIYVIYGGAPYIALGIALRTRPCPFVYGALAGAQLLAFLSVILLLAAMAMGWSDAPSGATAIAGGRIVVMVFALVQLAGFFWAVGAIRAWNGEGATREAATGVAAMIAWPLVAGLLAEYAGTQVDHLLYMRGVEDAQMLVRNAVRIQRCALQFAERNPEAGYPRGLAALGPSGTRCLERDDIAATHKRYTISYVPEPADDNDHTPSFVVRGSLKPNHVYGSFSIWGDSSATLRRETLLELDENGPPGDSMPAELESVRRCAAAMRADGSIPATIGELNAATKQVVNRVSYASRGCRGGTVAAAADSVDGVWYSRRTGYRVSYARVDDGYRIDGRPAKFGETALRSYMVADTGLVHFTTDDRRATGDDPALPPCPAYDVGDCSPTALTAPPQAQFIHPSGVRFDREYSLHIRVVGDTARLPTGLTWAFECNARALGATDAVPPRSNTNPIADQSCGTPRNLRPPAGDSIPVRLWLRNEAGLTAHVDGLIHVVRDTVVR